MKWKIEVPKNRRIWKAFKSEEEWYLSPRHISSRSRDIQDFCIMQHQNIHHLLHFIGYNMLIKFQFHCIITCRDILYILTSILSHPMTSSVSNLHNTKILNISGTRGDTTKRKTPLLFTPKGLSNSPTLQYLNFSFHRHFKLLFWLGVINKNTPLHIYHASMWQPKEHYRCWTCM